MFKIWSRDPNRVIDIFIEVLRAQPRALKTSDSKPAARVLQIPSVKPSAAAATGSLNLPVPRLCSLLLVEKAGRSKLGLPHTRSLLSIPTAGRIPQLQVESTSLMSTLPSSPVEKCQMNDGILQSPFGCHVGRLPSCCQQQDAIRQKPPW